MSAAFLVGKSSSCGRFTPLLAVLLFAACPRSPGGADAQVPFDAGNPPAKAACSGGCSSGYQCDPVKRVCVDGCGGCPSGNQCETLEDGGFACTGLSPTCGGLACRPGQLACVGDACTCSSGLTRAADTCASLSQWCRGATCGNPQRYEQCDPTSTSATCPSDSFCEPVFGNTRNVCVRRCGLGGSPCDKGEVCSNLVNGNGCLPSGLFVKQECQQAVLAADGGLLVVDGGNVTQIVTVSNTCLLKDVTGNRVEALGPGTGNCTYAPFYFWDDGFGPSPTCRPPGTAKEGEVCKDDWSLAGPNSTLCGTGLECARTTQSDTGVCLRLCNAKPGAGAPFKPSCLAGEACVNLYRHTDVNDNGVVGVCVKSCNVFDASRTCAAIGASATSCVPTSPTASPVLSLVGEGLCLPQRAAIAGLGQRCTDVDPFHGAACGTGQLCVALSPTQPPTCQQACDLDCAPADGGAAPTRCTTELGATCTGGTTCTQVSSSPSAHVGFCR